MPSVRSLIVRPKCPTQGPIGQPLVPDPRSSVDRTGIRALGPRCWNYARERRSPASGTSGGLNCLVGGTPGPSRRGPGRRPAAGAPILRDPAPDPRARRTRRLALRSSPDGLAGVRTRPKAFGRAGHRPSGGPANGLREGRPPAFGRAGHRPQAGPGHRLGGGGVEPVGPWPAGGGRLFSSPLRRGPAPRSGQGPTSSSSVRRSAGVAGDPPAALGKGAMVPAPGRASARRKDLGRRAPTRGVRRSSSIPRARCRRSTFTSP
jgi:hypothetical protein